MLYVFNNVHFKSLGNCIPPCASLTYDVMETMTGTETTTYETINFSDVTVRFSLSEFLPKRRQESNNILQLLSAFGGNLGLFVGASVMSLIELLYYFSVKICLIFFSINK